MRLAKPGDRVRLLTPIDYDRAHIAAGETGTVTYVGGDELGQYGVEIHWDVHHMALNFWENHTLIVEDELDAVERLPLPVRWRNLCVTVG